MNEISNEIMMHKKKPTIAISDFFGSDLYFGINGSDITLIK